MCMNNREIQKIMRKYKDVFETIENYDRTRVLHFKGKG